MRRIRIFLLAGIVWLVFACSGSAAEQPLVSLQAVEAEVADVLAALGRIGKVNIIADGLDAGKITVNFNQVNLDKVLEFIVKAKGLAYYRVDDMIIIGKRAAIASNFGDMHIFKLRFIDPAAAVKAAVLALGEISRQDKNFSGSDSAAAAKKQEIDYNISGRFAVDEATHTLLFYGSRREREQIEHVLNVLDVPYPQVVLEAKVVAINKDAAKRLGLEWEWSKMAVYQSNASNDDEENVKIGRVREGRSVEFYYAAQLNALVQNDQAHVLARPNVMTIDGKEAVINIGGEVPVPTVSVTNSTTKTSIEYREAGIILRYTPRLNEDGWITANVHTEVSSPVYVPDVKAYRFNKRSADTSIRLRDGEMMVIGGLIGSEEVRSVRKVPFLGDLPVLGRFFQNINQSKTESEVMIFLTAHIVK